MSFPGAYADRVFVVPASVEDYKSVHLTNRYDVICSHVVGQVVSNITTFAALTADLLRDSGTAIHTVDFGPCWGPWAAYEDPLFFLRFPDWLWYLMGSHRGAPNRQRLDAFVTEFQSAGLNVSVVVRKEFTKPFTARTLPKSVKHLPPESLRIATATLVCGHRGDGNRRHLS
jgi:hypothetical protein